MFFTIYFVIINSHVHMLYAAHKQLLLPTVLTYYSTI